MDNITTWEPQDLINKFENLSEMARIGGISPKSMNFCIKNKRINKGVLGSLQYAAKNISKNRPKAKIEGFKHSLDLIDSSVSKARNEKIKAKMIRAFKTATNQAQLAKMIGLPVNESNMRLSEIFGTTNVNVARASVGIDVEKQAGRVPNEELAPKIEPLIRTHKDHRSIAKDLKLSNCQVITYLYDIYNTSSLLLIRNKLKERGLFWVSW